MPADLALIVPTRGRPENIRKVISAWDFTNAWDVADLLLAVDLDDPEIQGYQALQEETRNPDTDEPLIHLTYSDQWVPMVHKLNAAAVKLAEQGRYFALGFAGDDHLPQTIGWAQRYLEVLRELGTGMVYGDDGYQGKKLSTEWAVTSDAVRALGRMVPASVEHMYCDNSIMDLFGAAGAMRHLPEIRIEHFNPYAGYKAPMDDQYKRVNSREQYKKDGLAYDRWKRSGLAADTSIIRDLRKGRPDVTPEPTPSRERPRVAGSAPRRIPPRIQRSGPTSRRVVEKPTPRPPSQFKNVRAATPEDVMVALADFAIRVPADQEIVELGVFQGRTALQLAWGASLGNNAHVTAIDPWDLPGNVYDPPFTDEESRRWARHWVDSFGYADRITLVQGFSHEVAEERTAAGGTHRAKVGLLFVDGDHTKEGARRDIETWAPHLAPGATIAVDDYGHPDWPGVGQAVDELVAEGFLEPIEMYHDRMAVTRLAGKVGDEIPSQVVQVTAITSEGVATEVVPGSSLTTSSPYITPPEVIDPDDFDVALSTYSPVEPDRSRVTLDEATTLQVSPGTEVADLTLPQLRALAKARSITLGIRKDKKAETLQAILDGR